MKDEVDFLPDKYRLAESAYNVYRNSQDGVSYLGHPIPDFEDSGHGQRPWLMVVLKAFDVLENASAYPFARFAEDLYDAWREGQSSFAFETLSRQTQLAWSAVARFISTVVANESDDPESFESAWSGWVKKKLTEPVTA